MSDNKPDSDKNEQHLFRNAMKQVKPIRQDKLYLKKQQQERYQAPADTTQDHPAFYSPDQPVDSIQGEQNLEFGRAGLQHAVLKKLKKGNFTLQATLDLHRLTAAQAALKVEEFIIKCSAEGKRWVCIIHGKGYGASDGQARLKSQLNSWLQKHAKVLAFHSAKPKDGGTGALYVIIKTT